MSARRMKIGVFALSAAVAVSTAGCATSLDSLPLPAPGVGGDSYNLKATFTNALNLPTKAKVKLNGADVGEVESMSASNYSAIVDMKIKKDVDLPNGTKAELRSATPLGDVFIALTPPENPTSAGSLQNGDSIPIESTSASATIEELLSRATLLVNGGAIRDMTTIVNGLGGAVDGKGDKLAGLIDQTTRLVNSLSARSGEIKNTLGQADALSSTISGQQQTINDAVAASGPAIGVIGENTQNLVDLVAKLNQITDQLNKFPSINGTGGRSMIADINKLAAGMNAAANDPQSNVDALNKVIPQIGKLTDSPAGHVNVDLVQLAAGALPDPNFSGDPTESRLPDVTDWNNFVGSLTYSLIRLRDKVFVGPVRPEPRTQPTGPVR